MDNYEILGQIGKGSFGLVQKIKRKSDGKVLVWKEMNYGRMSEREKQQLVAEVNIIRELRHSNIVRYYDRIIEKKDTKIFIIMEFCEGGDVGTLLKKCKKDKDYIAEDVIWKIFTQIVLALNECHNRPQGKILHRDLKPANIFLDAQNNIKLGDFGLSRVMGEQSEFADTHVGTPYYMSPEQIQEKKYNEKSDIWSAGCLLYEMAALKPPFEATNHLSLAIKIKSGKFERLPLRYSEELQKLIESMVHVEPEKRPSVQNILELPQISLRLKERKLRDKHSSIKVKEDELKKREEQIQERLDQIEKKEKDMLMQEQNLKELEEQVRQLEMQLMNRSSSLQQQIDEENLQKQDRNQGIPPQKSARGEYQLLSQNLNNFGKDLMLLNRISAENNSSGSSSKNSTATASNNTFELYKKEKENMLNNNSNLQNIDNYKKEKEIQKQLQAFSSNKQQLPIFQKSSSSIVSQSLTDQQLQLQQQSSQDTYSSQVVQSNNDSIPASQKGRTVSDAQLPPQNSCSSNSSNEANTTNPSSSNNKEKNYTLYMRREQDVFQKTPVNNNNYHQNYHTQQMQSNLHHQQSGEVESVTKKITSYSKDHQYKSVDHFTSIQNNNNSSSKKDESTAFSTTCKIVPQSASQNQNIINQSSNKSSHKSSCENLPKKSTAASSSNSNFNPNQGSNETQNQDNAQAAPIATGMTAFEKYKATILQQQQLQSQQKQEINNGYLNKYAQIKSKARQASVDSSDENDQKVGNNNYTSKLHTQQPISSKSRVQTSIDSATMRSNPESKNYLLNYRRDAPASGATTSSSAIARRSANNTIDSVKYSQINNSTTNTQTSTINNNNNNTPSTHPSHDIYKQVNIRRTDSYKENSFKNLAQQNPLKQDTTTPTSSSGNSQQTNSSTSLAHKNGQKVRSSLEQKNRLHSYHSTTSSSTTVQQQMQQQQQPQTSSSTVTLNKPPMTLMNNTATITSSGNDDSAQQNFKTLPNAEFSYDSNNINKMQIKKKNNNSFSTTPQQGNNTYLNTNSNYISNHPRSTTNGNNSGNSTARNNATESSIERKKDFPIRPRNNYLLPTSKLTPSHSNQQNGDVNMKNYFSEHSNNMTVQTDQLYNKYVSRKMGDQNVVSPSGQYIAANQYRTTTQY